MRVSIVVPIYDRPEDLLKTVDPLAQLDLYADTLV